MAKEQYRMKYYTRYMDDCVMLCNEKEYLKECLAAMEQYAEQELLLKFNKKRRLPL